MLQDVDVNRKQIELQQKSVQLPHYCIRLQVTLFTFYIFFLKKFSSVLSDREP